mmetsp:Transcript_41876/g.95437  ORF Transcript_41876/g.95437 Transcript_41876/m.95437 type:complete len:231 (-) Transcript_41876:173-865(-)
MSIRLSLGMSRNKDRTYRSAFTGASMAAAWLSMKGTAVEVCPCSTRSSRSIPRGKLRALSGLKAWTRRVTAPVPSTSPIPACSQAANPPSRLRSFFLRSSESRPRKAAVFIMWIHHPPARFTPAVPKTTMRLTLVSSTCWLACMTKSSGRRAPGMVDTSRSFAVRTSTKMTRAPPAADSTASGAVTGRTDGNHCKRPRAARPISVASLRSDSHCRNGRDELSSPSESSNS